jgi:hypothetical protein
MYIFDVIYKLCDILKKIMYEKKILLHHNDFK